MPHLKRQPYKLEEIENKNNFIVPDGYFDTFGSRLNERIKQAKPEASTHNVFRIFSSERLALAASFIGLLILLFTGVKYLAGNNNFPGGQKIEMVEAIYYPAYIIDDQMLFELYSSTLSKPEDEKALESDEFTEAMIQYLVNNEIDLQLIAQEL